VTLVDSNILLDIFTRTPDWWEWSLIQLDDAALHGQLLINDVIYAEASIRFKSIDDFDKALAPIGVTVARIPPTALFRAGKAFARYRKTGGVLPDFFIGAHAELEGIPLLTRDARRYRHYFPKVMLIAPGSGE
jgi:predicted nucleic acid-binding protein